MGDLVSRTKFPGKGIRAKQKNRGSKWLGKGPTFTCGSTRHRLAQPIDLEIRIDCEVSWIVACEKDPSKYYSNFNAKATIRPNLRFMTFPLQKSQNTAPTMSIKEVETRATNRCRRGLVARPHTQLIPAMAFLAIAGTNFLPAMESEKRLLGRFVGSNRNNRQIPVDAFLSNSEGDKSS